MRLEQVLFSQGFGTRRECRALIALGRVAFGGQVLRDPGSEVDPAGRCFEVDGLSWPFFEKAWVMLNKPAGWECSQKPSCHRPVMNLLPEPMRRRGMQPVGRLDADTTGLLLVTDDGQMLHRLTHPKHHVPKRYRITCKHPCSPEQIRALLSGVLLSGEQVPVRADSVRCIDAVTLEMTITQGKYHQVKRMVAAAGNRVAALHRTGFGALDLPGELGPGQWRWIDPETIILATKESN